MVAFDKFNMLNLNLILTQTIYHLGKSISEPLNFKVYEKTSMPIQRFKILLNIGEHQR